MQKIAQIIIDFIFPPKKEELELRSISPENLYTTTSKSGIAEFPFISFVFSYKYPLIRELVWQIKYKKNKHAIECAGYALWQELIKKYPKDAISSKSITLIPVPISKNRRKERGYNQSELIIDEILKYDKKNRFTKNYDLLIRIKDIEKQTLKNRSERLENTLHIFQVNKTALENPVKIIIIDDVTTTGSTIREARDTLIASGYRNIETMALAH